MEKAKHAVSEFYNNHYLLFGFSGILLTVALAKHALDNNELPRFEQVIIDCLIPSRQSAHTRLHNWFEKLGGTQENIDWYNKSKIDNSKNRGDINQISLDVARVFGIYSREYQDIATRILCTYNDTYDHHFVQGMDRIIEILFHKAISDYGFISKKIEAEIFYIYSQLVPSIFVGRNTELTQIDNEIFRVAPVINDQEFIGICRTYQLCPVLLGNVYLVGGLDHITTDYAIKLFGNIIYDDQMYDNNGCFDSDKAYEKILAFSYSLTCNTYHRSRNVEVCKETLSGLQQTKEAVATLLSSR